MVPLCAQLVPNPIVEFAAGALLGICARTFFYDQSGRSFWCRFSTPSKSITRGEFGKLPRSARSESSRLKVAEARVVWPSRGFASDDEGREDAHRLAETHRYMALCSSCMKLPPGRGCGTGPARVNHGQDGHANTDKARAEKTGDSSCLRRIRACGSPTGEHS